MPGFIRLKSQKEFTNAPDGNAGVELLKVNRRSSHLLSTKLKLALLGFGFMVTGNSRYVKHPLTVSVTNTAKFIVLPLAGAFLSIFIMLESPFGTIGTPFLYHW